MTGAAVRFDDLVAGTGLAFPPADRTIVATRPDQVRAALAEVDAATRAGAWAAGFVAYEAGAGLDPTLPVRTRQGDDPPLVWFAVSAAPTECEPVDEHGRPSGRYDVSPWLLEVSPEQHRADVGRARDRIAAGDTYQVNLTTRMHATVEGELPDLYADLAVRQRSAYAAYVDTGTHAVLSASPELFFEWTGGQLLTRPMKGTAPRGRTPAEDAERRRLLVSSEKERAENIIVVDLLRNDLGRIARIGSVRADRLCRAERYETVWQLTSDVRADVAPDTSLVQVFAAIFPSGSVTGAPKPSTMGIIGELEPGPRGVYCGAIGWVAPPEQRTRARFNVAIRTAVVDRRTGRATYGVGSGITWGSEAEHEFAELRAKARILDHPATEFGLIETMACAADTGIRNVGAHVERLAASAQYFGFAFDRRAVDAALDQVAARHTAARVRLTLDRTGALTVQTTALPQRDARPVTLAIDAEPIDSTEPWPFHKTTRREPYVLRAARHDSDDVVLVNEQGHVTETTIANLAVRLDATWWTPPLDDGCLPGVERGRLVAAGQLRERTLTPADLVRAEALALVSSLRGWRDAVLADAGAGPRPDPVSNAPGHH